MQQHEYLVFYMDSSRTMSEKIGKTNISLLPDHQTVLNTLAVDGWEPHSVTPWGEGWYVMFVMRRPIQPT
jgi:hypothetical protein